MLTPLECTRYFIESGFDWIVSGDDTDYYMEDYTGNGDYVIAFYGSDSKIDWRNNFRFWKVPYKHMEVKFYVHAGFLKCWKLVEDEIIGKLRSCNFRTLTITGHSYGGAISILCKESVWFNFPEKRDKVKLMAFGSPRVIGLYNWRKIKERWDNSLLLSNGSDIVTKIPFASMLYRHVRKVTHIGDVPRLFKYFKAEHYHSIDGYRSTLERISR